MNAEMGTRNVEVGMRSGEFGMGNAEDGCISIKYVSLFFIRYWSMMIPSFYSSIEGDTIN